ncbi:DNA-binding HxlR family transcriptional regulator [Streptosporangium becharense]|uniref:DNA-binding HxlR family transcriptional regulator n=1 Tax=Streptosporangium becharense TaxID=1816182 RepID=A0A7W9IGZ3_9ACTN|nr:helix-turn-helix domain-containing protein [Streptosporangium becharense]MBB2912649.1 DNA-binding HxlR family transcriptional regulator [Streptosporangium becharense]MBB5820522.1 DNA-binding HxlR family transcriptional regulator [Streptosporangium becharense]
MSEAPRGNLPFRVDNCSIERALGVVGEKWTFLVLREAFAGVRRFADMQAATGAPRQVLSARLTRLVDEGLLRKVPYREPGQRQRDEYRLTQMGVDLYPALVALMHWGDRYLSDREGPPVHLTHRGCGALIEQRFRCAAGHEVAGPREVTPVAGPGAPAARGAAGTGRPAVPAAVSPPPERAAGAGTAGS